jgi:hypothetical protein
LNRRWPPLRHKTRMTRDEAKEEAAKILAADYMAFTLRSCWNCNSAHDHLQNADHIIRCFVCGHTFYKGFDLTDEPEST